MPSGEIRAETEIDASPEAVWAVLADVRHWSSWNRILLGLDLRGPLQAGTRGRLSLRLPRPLGERTVPIRVDVVEPDRELTWSGGVRRALHGRHGFRLVPTATGTRVIHTEVFTGVLSPALRLVGAEMTRTYERVNADLRRRCETGG